MCTGASQGLTRAWALTWRFGGLSRAACYGVIGGPSVEDRVSTSHARADDMTQSPQSDWRDWRERESRRGLSSSSSLSSLFLLTLNSLSRDRCRCFIRRCRLPPLSPRSRGTPVSILPEGSSPLLTN
jgi:hypothetical protein